MNLRQKVGAAIQRIRKDRGLSQEQLGTSIGLDQGYVSRIEQGKMNLTLDTIEEICRVLECEAGDLVV